MKAIKQILLGALVCCFADSAVAQSAASNTGVGLDSANTCDDVVATMQNLEISPEEYGETLIDMAANGVVSVEEAAAVEEAVHNYFAEMSSQVCAKRNVTQRICVPIPFCGVYCFDVTVTACTGTCSNPNLTCQATLRPDGSIKRCSCKRPVTTAPGQSSNRAEGSGLRGEYTCLGSE